MSKEKYPVNEQEKKTGERKANYPPSKKRYLLIFKHNREFELHLRGKIFHRFGPNSTLGVDENIINHPDFTPEVKAYFTIKEQSNG